LTHLSFRWTVPLSAGKEYAGEKHYFENYANIWQRENFFYKKVDSVYKVLGES
jgi:hypothetical protein